MSLQIPSNAGDTDLDSTIGIDPLCLPAPKRTAETNPVKANHRNINSKALAIKAMCSSCMGCDAKHREPGFVEDIRDCSSQGCPLWIFRPYRTRTQQRRETAAVVEESV